VTARALKDGAIGFLAKPFDGGTLINCLNTALSATAAEQASKEASRQRGIAQAANSDRVGKPETRD
jgi:FixJ family two-component response regulator